MASLTVQKDEEVGGVFLIMGGGCFSQWKWSVKGWKKVNDCFETEGWFPLYKYQSFNVGKQSYKPIYEVSLVRNVENNFKAMFPIIPILSSHGCSERWGGKGS